MLGSRYDCEAIFGIPSESSSPISTNQRRSLSYKFPLKLSGINSKNESSPSSSPRKGSPRFSPRNFMESPRKLMSALRTKSAGNITADQT